MRRRSTGAETSTREGTSGEVGCTTIGGVDVGRRDDAAHGGPPRGAATASSAAATQAACSSSSSSVTSPGLPSAGVTAWAALGAGPSGRPSASAVRSAGVSGR